MTDLPHAVARAWHLVALSKGLPVGARQGVTVAGRSVVLFRGDQGLGALIDRCPHRNNPLSLGRVEGGASNAPITAGSSRPQASAWQCLGANSPAQASKN